MQKSAARSPVTSSPDPAAPCRRPRPHPRRIRNPSFTGAALARVRRCSTAAGGRRSGPSTPLLRWKFDDLSAENADPPGVSARKLAAGIWHLQLQQQLAGAGTRGGGDGGRDCLGFELNPGPLHVPPHDCDHDGFNHQNECSRAIPVHHSRHGLVHKSGASAASSIEGATKWDPGFSKASDEVYRIYNHLKHLEDQQVNTGSVVVSLRAELELARAHISELEDERRSAKKKLNQFLGKLAEEKTAWRSREHQKVQAVIDAMKDDFKRERKNRQRMEIVNSKLVNELAEAKLTAKRFLHDYEKERKAREVMEEVCEELAKEIAEDKAEVEELKMESAKMQEEVDEERRMLQMAEVWREERVQMKLIDAKLTLDEKYSQLSKLQADMEAFLRTKGRTNSDVQEIKDAEFLREAASSVKVQEIKAFSYQPPPPSEDIFSVFEELQLREETNKSEIEQCEGYSPESRASNVQSSSPDINAFLKKPIKRYGNQFSDINGHVEDDSDWETGCQREGLGSSNSPEGSDPSVNGSYKESNTTVSGTHLEENGNKDQLSSEISEAYSSMTKQSRKKASSIIRLLRSSSPNNGEKYKKHSVEATNGRPSNGRMSNATLSPARKSESGLSSSSVGQWSSPDSLNPHMILGTKGCIDWPRGMQKQNLKSKLKEASMDNQKVQLRHVLKQRI